eukprot:CAMPEP_0178749400 /NCGR_PEP_ID=MMETSP0744-20121128/9388_1 /TAXON_ID=913974 /ORGANISM="Nitzschia punctata, Strain CCMP561" /LENGTH=519 /DNA_ID=CAMNT_0020402807 /DNA_START=15 /DNA_END=1574 /DNA_ORIENTATION=+
MRLITGDECGLLKECIPELSRKKKDPNSPVLPFNSMPDVTKEGVCRVDPTEFQTRERGVIDMVWMQNSDDKEYSFAALRKNGSIDIWNAEADDKKYFGRFSLERTTKNVFYDDSPRPLGLGFFNQQNRICAGDMLGNLVVLDCKSTKSLDILQTYNAYTANKREDTISYTPGKMVNTQIATAIAFDSAHGRVAVGGRERETSLIDLGTGKLVFKSKNLPPDPQTLLQQPVWPTAIEFLNEDCNVMAVGTAYKQVRLYDVRENSKTRRPTATTSEGLLEYRVTSLCQVDGHEVVVGDTAGYIYSLDLRRMGKNLKDPANRDMGRYVGPAGSVRQLKKHPTLPRLAAVGLDRMLRIYDTKKRKQLDCIYLKQRLNCVLFHPDDTWDVDKDDFDPDDVDIDQDDEVRDYVDSDEDQSVSLNSEASDESSKQDNVQVANDELELISGDGEEGEDDSSAGSGSGEEKSSAKNDSEDEANTEPDNEDDRSETENSESEETEENNDEDEEEDEVIVVKAPKRRRRG